MPPLRYDELKKVASLVVSCSASGTVKTLKEARA
jgi:hypothetical protein